MVAQTRAKLRHQLAQHAARLMAVDGVASFAAAKEKAAQQLGVRDPRRWPDNREVESALAGYQRLFQCPEQEASLGRLRRAALQAMRALAAFRPRLVGPVLSGTAVEHSPVCLHVFNDTAEEVCLALSEQGIVYRSAQRRLRLDPKQWQSYPSFSFLAGEIEFEIIVFPPKGLRQSPLSPVDGRPMQRADMAAVENLLALGV